MIAYKFLPRCFAEDASRGRFQISLLTIFNGIEDNEIRDEDDGKSAGFTNKPFTISEEITDATMRERFERHRFGRVSTGGKIINLGGETKYEVTGPPAYVLCLSTDRNCKKWLTGDGAKDAVVTIRGVNILAQAIAERHNDILQPPIVRRISYDQRRVDFLQEDLGPVDPFKKRPTFRDEAELRVLFPAVGEPAEQSFITDCRGLDDILAWQSRE